MDIVNKIKFIQWDELGIIVTNNKGAEANISLKGYAEKNNYRISKRIPSAVKELLTLAKIYQFNYIKTPKGYTFPEIIVKMTYETVIVSAIERDIILQAQKNDATDKQKKAAKNIVEEILLLP